MQLSDVTFQKRELLLESSGWTRGLCTCPLCLGHLELLELSGSEAHKGWEELDSGS